MQFNISPYFDDFSESKNTVRVLFKPTKPIQARELNTIQSMFLNQIKNFANHMFKNGTVISDGRISFITYDAIKFDAVDVTFALEGMLMLGVSSGQSARFICLDRDTIVFQFTGTGSDGTTISFFQDETIRFINDSAAVVGSVTVLNDPEFKSTTEVCVVEKGVFYYNGFFIETARQLVPITASGDYDLGFRVKENIITPAIDQSLLDNNTSVMSYLNPGADRYQIVFSLEIKAVGTAAPEDTSEDFIVLARVEGGQKTFINQDTRYAEIGDYMAKRTYEESGNYTVAPFTLTVKNHKAENALDDTGYSVDGLSENYVSIVSPGVGYVRGYRAETIANTNLISRKARDTKLHEGYAKLFEERTYVKAIPNTSGSIFPNSTASDLIADDSVINLYDGVIGGGGTPTGSLIGTMKVADMIEEGMTTELVPRKIYRYYITSISIDSGKKLKDVKSLYRASSTFAADAYLEPLSDLFVVYNPGTSEFLWDLDRTSVKSMRSINDPKKGSITYTKRKKVSGVLSSIGDITFKAPTGEYFKPYNKGTVALLTSAGITSTVVLDSDNSTLLAESLSVVLGAGQSGKTLTVILDVLATNLAEKVKTLTDEVILEATPDSSSYTLSKSDIVSFSVNVYIKADPTNELLWTDISENFDLFNGMEDTRYVNAVLSRNDKSLPFALNSGTHGLRIAYTYFHHSGDAGFFTVDSYVGVALEDIPHYKSAGGKSYALESCFDFRPLFIDAVIRSVASYPTIKQIALFDLEYYLGRVDSLVLHRTGTISIQKGIAGDNPVPLKLDDDFMVLYNLELKPYTYSLEDIRIKYIDNKRYTMRDINLIESRLSDVEYYVALNLLEKSAVDMSIKDLSGLNRFKNGFVVDNFQDFQAGDTSTSEFRAAIDPKRSELRPSFFSRQRTMSLNPALSYGYQNIDGVLYASFITEVIDEQAFATKHISVNPYFMTTKRGSITLFPNNDTWADTVRSPLVQVNLDTGGKDALQAVADYTKAGLAAGEWATNNRTLVNSATISSNTTADIIQNAVSTITNTTTSRTVRDTFSLDQTRRISGIDMSSRTDTYNLGDRVTNVSIKPYIRSNDVTFRAKSLLPTTRVYAFFDNQAVSEFCRPLNGLFGEPLVTDAAGNVDGIFRIPEGRFFVGEKQFKLTGSIDNKSDVDEEFTKATSTYFAGGIEVTKERVELNVVTPVYNYTDYAESRTVQSDVVTTFVNSSSSTLLNPIASSLPAVIGPKTLVIQANNQIRNASDSQMNTAPPVYTFTGTEFAVRGLQSGDSVSAAAIASEGAATSFAGSYPISISGATISNPAHYTDVVYLPGVFTVILGNAPVIRMNSGDPVAQSFKTTTDRFITGIDVFFADVDMTSNKIFVEIRTMKNGYPTQKVLARKTYTPSEIAPKKSSDSSVPFHVDFQYPVYVKGNEDYCFVVGGNSPGTRIWVAKLGDKVIDNPSIRVETQPSLGSSFRSQNGSTWNAEQFEDIKYRLYGAIFQTQDINLNFNLDYQREALDLDPFEVEVGYKTLRIYMKNHGFVPGDEFYISMFEKEHYELYSPAGIQPTIGQVITTDNGTATITDVIKISASSYTVTVKELKGLLVTGSLFSCPSVTINDSVAPTVYGNITVAPVTSINGVSLAELNGTLTVKSVDSIDSFLVDIVSTPSVSGRFGGSGVSIDANYRYDMHNTSGVYESYSANESWEYAGIDEIYNAVPSKPISMKADYYLDRGNKVSNAINEERKGIKSVVVNGRFTWDDIYITPVFNLNTFSTIFVNNIVDDAKPETINVKPNSVGRYLAETDPSKGSHSYKYVTKTIQMSKPAVDMRIAFDVFKDYEADFDIYIKTKEQYNTDQIDDYPWELLTVPTKKHSSNLKDRIEYEITASESMDPLDWDDRSFDTFKLKIVGRTTNPSKPPLFKNLRIVAFT